MNLTINKIKRIQNRSAHILDIFTRTIKDLSIINANIDDAKDTRVEKMSTLQVEINDLQLVKDNNDKIITKINSLFV